MVTKKPVESGSGNIFADLGIDNADRHELKARVVIIIGRMIEQAGLTQQAAARRMGISQPDVSNLLRGRFENFSLERLLGFVLALGNDVDIKIKRRDEEKRAGRMRLMAEA
jgi:predicted XRE-type DNA-binding protein